MRIDLETFGETQLSRELLRYSDRADDVSPYFKAAAVYFRQAEARQFSTSGSAGGKRWSPLAASTVRRKARLKQDPRILRATMNLFKSLTQPEHPDHIEQITPDSLFVGSRDPKGRFHQKGNEPIMPQRRPVSLTEFQRRAMVLGLQRYLVNGSTTIGRFGL